MIHKNCTCEYCCFVRDEEDDERMEMEYKVAMSSGKALFDELKVGDSVEYYQIPVYDRNIIYLPEHMKWEKIEEMAKKRFHGVVISKTEYYMQIDNSGNSKQKISPAECWVWGMRKIINNENQ